MIEDLANNHSPITSLFPRIADGETFRLTDDQIEFFRKNGYLAGIPILTPEQIDVLRRQLAQLLAAENDVRQLFYEYHTNESDDPAKVLFHALGAWRVASAFHDLLWHPGVLMPASQLLGGAVRFWHDQIFYKPALHGGVVAWHQDYSYWTRTKPMAHLSCWIGLDDSNRENGCVHYVPGSHLWNLLPITGLAQDMDAIQTVLTEGRRKHFNPIPIELRAGEASFHHPLMVHGSFENTTEKPRRAVVLNFFLDGVTSDSDVAPLEGVPAVRRGEKMNGKFFPLLFDPLQWNAEPSSSHRV